MIKVIATLTCLLWPGNNPTPLVLPRNLTLAPSQTMVISYEAGHHFGRIPVPNPTVGVEVRVAESGSTIYVSLTNHSSQIVNLLESTTVANLIVGQCKEK